MKSFLKGVFLGFALIVTNRLCVGICAGFNTSFNTGFDMMIVSAILFFITATLMLISRNIPSLLICGFTGVFIMFATELTIGFVGYTDFDFWLIMFSYVGGFYGSMAALIVALVLTAKNISLSKFIFKEGVPVTNEISNSLKIKLLIYIVISAIGFSYLILPQYAGISVPIFAIIQLTCLWFIVPDRRRLILFIPIMILSLNSLTSANSIWKLSNLVICLILYCCMYMSINFKSDSLSYILDISERLFTPFEYSNLPFKWVLEINNKKAPIIKRVLIALAVAVPTVIMLIAVLSNADMVFSVKTQHLISDTLGCVSFNVLLKIAFGIAAGTFMFGAIYSAYVDKQAKEMKAINIKGDLIIINILLSAVLVVYTLFVIIQFKYLFASSALPYGLTYTEYARKGFFELLALTGVNIAAILAATMLTKNTISKWSLLTKALCHYLCAVTMVLLISSFYRMLLYTWDDGLTRLRFFVLGFLIFEAIGLLITFVYIAKPKFNITAIYIAIALVYYMVLNIIPTDNIIAKNQIDKYLKYNRTDLAYTFTLSVDAAPAMKYLFESTDNQEIKEKAKTFLDEKTTFDIPSRWQRYNLSIEKAKGILDNLN